MPFYLAESDVLPECMKLRSILIVPCRFCPAASLAVRRDKPYIELFRRFLRTNAYESYIRDLTKRLQNEGIRTEVFDSKLLHQFVACMWTSRRREALATRAADFDGAVILGCDAMVDMVRDALKPTDCSVIAGMDIEGLMNVLPNVSFPFKLWLRLQSVTPVTSKRSVA